MNAVKKTYDKGRLLTVDPDERSATFCMTTASLDRDGEIVNPQGGILDDFAKNPLVAWNHNLEDELPIGTMEKDGQLAVWQDQLDIDGRKQPALLGKVYFSAENPKADLIYRMVREGTVRACSISFVPVGPVGKNRNGGNVYDRWKLLEVSIVPLGSNPHALRMGLRRGMAIMKRHLWVKDKAAWLLKAEGPVEDDDQMQEYLQERQLDDVRLEEEAPPAAEGWQEVIDAVAEAVADVAAEGAAAALAGGTEEPPEEPEAKQQPSAEISPEDACRILEEGQVHGEPLTEDQRGLFGAACARAQKHFKRCKACLGKKALCPACVSTLRKTLGPARRVKQPPPDDRDEEEKPPADEPPPEEEPLPPGQAAVERWIGMIERDLRGIEQQHVVAAAGKALDAFRAALGKAYGDGPEEDPEAEAAREKKLADLVDRLEQNETRISEALFRASGRRLN